MRALNTPTSPDSEVLRGKRNDQTNIDQGNKTLRIKPQHHLKRCRSSSNPTYGKMRIEYNPITST